MQQRSEPHDSLDDFPTPPWATRALCEWIYQAPPPWPLTVREPAANRGYMARPLAEYFRRIEASDVHDYGVGFPVADYLFGPDPETVDWTITNPPFRLAQQFIDRALRTSRAGVAVIVRAAFLEGQERYCDLFSRCPPTDVLQFAERVVMHRGRVVESGSTATAYAWLVWEEAKMHHRNRITRLGWIAPCRASLERPGDYDIWPPVDAP